MSQQTKTPSGKASKQEKGTTELPPTESEGNTASSGSRTFPEIRDTLKRNGMFMEHKSIFKDNSDFGLHVQKIVLEDRTSPMKPASCERIAKNTKKLAMANEETVTEVLKNLVIKPSRMTNKDLDGKEFADYVCRLWEDDHLDMNKDVVFRGNVVPLTNPNDELVISKELAKSGLSSPKPDYVFGLEEDAFNDHEVRVNDKYRDWAGISPRIWHPFLILEWKSYQGLMVDAENQVCRAGATVVHANRLLRSKASDYVDTQGADKDSFVFSATLGTDRAKIWVHWAFVRGKAVDYHMDMLSEHLVTRSVEATSLRNNLHNVLDWGLLDRRVKLKKVLENIYKRDRAKFVATPAPTSDGSPSLKKRKQNSDQTSDA